MSVVQRQIVSAVLSTEHRRLIGLYDLPDGQKALVAVLVAHAVRPRALLRSAQVAGWPALGVEILTADLGFAIGLPRTERVMAECQRVADAVRRQAVVASSPAVRTARVTAAVPVAGTEAAHPSRPAGWSVNAWWTGGE